MSNDALHYLSRTRMKVENAFGRFKNEFARFSCRVIRGEKAKNLKIIKSALFIHDLIIDDEVE